MYTLAALHAVDAKAVGLSDIGRAKALLTRQISRWIKQYKTTESETIPAMDNLMKWLLENVVEDGEAALFHGDFRSRNVIAGEDDPKILTLLDWALCALGHPMANLGYVCALYLADVLPTGRMRGLDQTAFGTLTEQDFWISTANTLVALG